MDVLALSGSARAASTNTALLRGLARAAPPGVRVTLAPNVADLPVFSPDREGPPAPAPVEAFAAMVARTDALVICAPEYVHALPGGLKNALDWLVSRPELVGKPIALIHASHRGDDMLADLRRVLATLSDGFAPGIFARFALMKMTPEDIAAELAMPAAQDRLRGYLAALEAHVRKVASAPEAGLNAAAEGTGRDIS